jgi:HEAT repeat protein
LDWQAEIKIQRFWFCRSRGDDESRNPGWPSNVWGFSQSVWATGTNEVSTPSTGTAVACEERGFSQVRNQSEMVSFRTRKRAVAFCAIAIGIPGLLFDRECLAAQSQDQVPTLLSQLQDKNPEVRIAAIRRLAQLQDRRAVAPLIETISRDSDPEVRRSAAYGLGQLKDGRAIEPLIGSLKDEHPEVCINAIFSLVQVGDGKRLDALIASLAHQNLHVCRAAAVGLALLGDKRAVDPLIRALKDQRITVRSGAAFALGFLSDKRAVPALLSTLQDDRPVVRKVVIGSLGLLGDKRAVPALSRLAAKDPDPEVRARSADVLQKLTQSQTK